MLNTYISFATAPICIMNIREIVKDAVVLVLILFLLSVPAVILFFADGGQIIGLNYDPEKIPVPDGTVGVDGLTWEALDEPIEPIDDGTEIIQIELWQLPPRDILIRLVVSHMAYIPPSFSHLLSILYLSLGLGFFVLYRQKIKQKQRSQNSRREIIYQTILHIKTSMQTEISEHSATDICCSLRMQKNTDLSWTLPLFPIWKTTANRFGRCGFRRLWNR